MKGYIGGASSIYIDVKQKKNTCKIVRVENKSSDPGADGTEILEMGLQIVK